MSAEEQTRLQIGHVLFIDIVGYSKLLVNEQSGLLRELNELVSGTREFREAEAEGKLIRLPTGDGMALVFRDSPEAPAQCALEIARALKEHPRIALRMGIHSGPVNEVVDVNQRQNIAGAGINMAQRVMDCGDAGHIFVSKHVAEDLEQHDRWRPLLQFTAEPFQQSDALYRKVLAIDPRYAPAWYGLAAHFGHETGQGLMPAQERIRQTT